MPTPLQKIIARAKQLRKKHPSAKWTNLVKQAGKDYKSGKIGATKKQYRQTGKSSAMHDEMLKAKAPGKRTVKHRGGKKTVYYERRKNRSDKPGSLTGIDKSRMVSSLNELVRELSNIDGKIFHLKLSLKNKAEKHNWPLLRKNLAYQEKKAKIYRENITNLKRLI